MPRTATKTWSLTSSTLGTAWTGERWTRNLPRRVLDTAADEERGGVVCVMFIKISYGTNPSSMRSKGLPPTTPIKAVAMLTPSLPVATGENNLRQQDVVCPLLDADATSNVLFDCRVQLLYSVADSSHQITALRGSLEKGSDPNMRD